MATKSKTKLASTVEFKETDRKGNPVHTEQPVHADTDSGEFNFGEFMKMLGVQIPSWKRVLVSFVACFAAGYLIGSVASVLMDIVVTGALSVTGSMFVAWMFYAIGLVIAIYAAFCAGRAISKYILSGSIDQDFVAAKNWFGNMFSRKEKVIAAA